MADALTEADVTAFLHEMIADYDPRDLDTFYWYEKAIEILPDRLNREFLDRFFASVPVEQQVFVIGKLAAFGHGEIADVARGIIPALRADAAQMLELAIALMRCGDPEAESALGALYAAESVGPKSRHEGTEENWRCELAVPQALLRLGTPAALALRFRLITDGMSASTVDRNELVRLLRSIAEPIVEDEEWWCRKLAPAMSCDPLPAELLDEALAPLSMSAKSRLLEFLARIGRTEVREPAARLSATPDIEGLDLLWIGEALLRCQDSRGAAVLESLYVRSLDRKPLDRATVLCNWITDDVLSEEIGTLEALLLRRKLRQLGMRLKAPLPDPR